MNLSEIRAAVRAQLDVEEDDLPTAQLDLFIREAFDKTIAAEERWPFYQTSWSVSATDDGEPIVLPVDVASIASVVDTTYRPATLSSVSMQQAEAEFVADSGGVPLYFSEWGQELYLWPAADEERTLTVRGWRTPTDWVTAGAATEVDADYRLHLPLIHYAASRAYAAQEDEQLSAFYYSTWAACAEAARTAIMRPSYQGISVMGSGFRG